MTMSILNWCKNIVHPRRMVAFLAVILALITCSCAATTSKQVSNPEMCDVTKFEPGHPDCLPPPGFFCVAADDKAERSAEITGASGNVLGQLFPSKQALGGNQPECPSNATRLIQDMDWRDAKKGAWMIGRKVGWTLAICERVVENLARQPDNILAGQNNIQPEELEAHFMNCANELKDLPAIPAYEDPWLAGAARIGFIEGYGEGEREVWLRLLLIDIAVSTLEAAIMPGVALVEIAATRGLRATLSVVRRMPIFLPGAISGAGAFLKNAPLTVAKVVAEGSSRILARNMKRVGWTRLPGEFAHHIVAHGDYRAKKALDILKNFGIKVDDAVNGVYLPGYKTSPNPHGKMVHGNLHTNAYNEAVEKALDGVTTQAQVIQRLRLIAWKLEHGMMP